jgi:hypothetical protein
LYVVDDLDEEALSRFPDREFFREVQDVVFDERVEDLGFEDDLGLVVGVRIRDLNLEFKYAIFVQTLANEENAVPDFNVVVLRHDVYSRRTKFLQVLKFDKKRFV